MNEKSDWGSDAYYQRIYGDIDGIFGKDLEQFAKESDFITAKDFYSDYKYGQYFKGNEAEVQVCTVQGKYIPYTYDEKMAYALVEFSENTSAHGIPQIRRSTSIFKVYWVILYLFCLGMFLYQAVNVVEKYQRNEKIVDIETLWTNSTTPTSAYGTTRKESSENLDKHKTTVEEVINVRKKRMSGAMFEPAVSHCDCTQKDKDEHCKDLKEEEPPDTEDPPCLCAFDRAMEDAWPCHERETWTEETCDTCNDHGFCPPASRGAPRGHTSACFCNTAGVGFCVAYPAGSQVLKLWEFYGFGPPTEDPLFLEAMGFAGMTDEVAIVTKAKENVMFAMSSLTLEDREMMSYKKTELIHKCSFNGGACDISSDFRTHMDPVFGACYTFNWDPTGNMTSNRAGPMYGMRILVYVNTTEYLPTTEAAGVRLTIHEKSAYPFPDTFGYSAPTGFISSFGIRLRLVHRMPAPYGNCIPTRNMLNYIYEGYDYSTEGCFRSCFQQLVLRSCGCGDPRFPVIRGYRHCDAADPVARRCLNERTAELGGLHGSFSCQCQQPCEQATYDVTYSASKWPSKSLKVQLGSCEGTPEECIEHYKEHGAMIEVFYEQLNFEMLSESQAYGLVNLLADFGGQLGLWLGVSVLTCFEFIMLVWRLIFLTVIHQYEEYKKRKAEKERLKNAW